MVHAQHSAEHHGHHIVPFKTLLTIFSTLIVLTVVTVLVAQVHLGPLNVPIALAIAIAKATLVVMFFMALKYDRPVNTLVFLIGIIFVIIFLTFTWFDTGFRGDLGNVDRMTIQDRTYMEEQLRAREPRAAGATAATDTTSAGSADADTSDAAAPADTAAATEAEAAVH